MTAGTGGVKLEYFKMKVVQNLKSKSFKKKEADREYLCVILKLKTNKTLVSGFKVIVLFENKEMMPFASRS